MIRLTIEVSMMEDRYCIFHLLNSVFSNNERMIGNIKENTIFSTINKEQTVSFLIKAEDM